MHDPAAAQTDRCAAQATDQIQPTALRAAKARLVSRCVTGKTESRGLLCGGCTSAQTYSIYSKSQVCEEAPPPYMAAKQAQRIHPLDRQINTRSDKDHNTQHCVNALPGFREDDFLTRPGRWSRFALLHRHQITDIGEYCFEVRHLSTPGRASVLKKSGLGSVLRG